MLIVPPILVLYGIIREAQENPESLKSEWVQNWLKDIEAQYSLKSE